MDIRPDPKHPRGGYACISLEPGTVPGDEVSLTLRNSFNDKYLGQEGWQSEKAFFGPYRLQPGDDGPEFVVGTEIVNQVEEYTMLVIGIGDREIEVSWPDDVMQGPPAATVGGVSAAPPKASGSGGPALVGKARPEPEPEPEVTPGPEDADAVPAETETAGQGAEIGHADPEPGQGGGRRTGLIAALVLLAAVGAGVGYWILTQAPGEAEVEVAEDVQEPVAPPPAAEPEVAEAPDPCTEAALAATTADGYGALIGELKACGGAVSADAALGLIEQGVDAQDPAALVALGQLYDEARQIDVVETEIGLTFADNPARAAEYYARAVEAGDGVGSAEALAAVCLRLAKETDTLSNSARLDYCPE